MQISPGNSPWGSCILSQPRNSNFEFSPWKWILGIFWKAVQNQKPWIFHMPDHNIRSRNNQVPALLLSPYARLVDFEKGFKMVVSRPLYDQTQRYFLFISTIQLLLPLKSRPAFRLPSRQSFRFQQISFCSPISHDMANE